MPQSPTSLVLSSRQFEEVFLEYRPVFVRRAYRYVRDNEIAEDIVSDSFMTFWEGRGMLPEDVNVPAYIFTIVRNRCLNYLRDKAVHLQAAHTIHSSQRRLVEADIASLTACNPDRLFQEEIFSILQRALDKMPEKTRTVFLKSRFSGMSYNDISEELGILPSGVHLEIHRGLNILRSELKDYLPALLLIIGGLHNQ
ncbi:MAG: RNA polymerase sigma-70 factor [Alistipes sp.]|nr:RNA polymerase sigma-70 factor [Alistipes sp.]